MKITRKIAIAAVALSLFGGLSAASAASLNISANNTLAAGTSVTASCQGTGSTIGVSYPAPSYVSASQTFTVSSVKLTSVAQACGGKNIQVVVADSTGAQLSSYTGVVPTTANATQDLTLSISPAANSASVGSVSVVIYS